MILSDYYELRRATIVDTIAAMGFATGLVAAMVMRWSILNINFRTGNFARAVFDFSKTMLGWGIVGGVLGLGTGVIIAGAWQRFHMAMRQRRSTAVSPATLKPETAKRTPHAPSVARLENIRFDETGFTVGDFLKLTGRVWPRPHDAESTERAARALSQTMNIGAWEDARLIGAVRILSDGYMVTTVTEVLVDPAYRKRGVGRELMQRALARSPTGTLSVSATNDSVGFFQRLGCELAPMGFVLRTWRSGSA